MEREQVERMWFRRVVIVMMVVGMSFGAVPLLKNTFFPVAKVR
jgi:cytochrome c oxidase assembly protein Cox11